MTNTEPIFFYDSEEKKVIHTAEVQRSESPIYSAQEGASYTKQLSKAERNNFNVIDKYRTTFLQQNPIIIFPQILSCTESDLCTMSSPPHFHQEGAFHHSVDEYETILSSFDQLRNTIDVSDLQHQSDPDEHDSIFTFLVSILNDVEMYVADRKKITDTLESTQNILIKVPELPGHGDAHNQNWSIAQLNEKKVVSFIDLETFGMYRVGWDEGRMYALLSGYLEDQQHLLQAIEKKQHFDSYSECYFWRTALIRSLRDIQLISNGKRFTHLNEMQKTIKVQEYLKTANQALRELSHSPVLK